MNSTELNTKIASIITKLENANLIEFSTPLKSDVLSCGIPGEKLDVVAHILNHLKLAKVEVYSVIKIEADEIISYAKSINYL